MPPIKRSAEDAALNLEEAPPAKRGRDSVTGQSFNFESLPVELKLEAIREVAHQSNRVQAREELANLWNTNKHMRALINETADLKESWDALQRNPGVESRYIALCHDVVRGISVKDALRQNGPLPKEDKLRPEDVYHALSGAGAPQLAPLAEEFSGRHEADIDLTFLKGVADRAARLFIMRDANLEETATFAKAFTRHTDKEFLLPLNVLGFELRRRGPGALPEANIEQVAKLADAFGTKDGAHYANRATPRPPLNADRGTIGSYTNSINHFSQVGNEVIERLALTVTTRSDELLRGASAEQLDMMKRTFSEGNGPSCPSAVEKIDELVKNLNPNNRPQLERRERSPVGR